jgi:hypothetical protein
MFCAALAPGEKLLHFSLDSYKIWIVIETVPKFALFKSLLMSNPWVAVLEPSRLRLQLQVKKKNLYSPGYATQLCIIYIRTCTYEYETNRHCPFPTTITTTVRLDCDRYGFYSSSSPTHTHTHSSPSLFLYLLYINSRLDRHSYTIDTVFLYRVRPGDWSWQLISFAMKF